MSPHYLAKPPHVRTIQEMSIRSVMMCRRDLLLRGVLPDRIWDAIVQWSSNPLFQIDRRKPNSRSNVLVLVNEGHSSVRALLDVLHEHQDVFGDQFARSSLQIGQPPAVRAEREVRQKVYGAYASNVASVGARTEEVLRLQESVTLAFHVTAFNADYAEASRTADEERKALIEEFGVDPDLPAAPRSIRSDGSNSRNASSIRHTRKPPKPIWSRREERVFYASIAHVLNQTSSALLMESALPLSPFDEQKYQRHAARWRQYLQDRALEMDKTCLDLLQSKPAHLTPEQLFAAARAGHDRRVSAKKRIERFDLARAHLRAFRSVWERMKSAEGVTPIHTSYSCLHTRRFQAESFWPNFVASRRSWADNGQSLPQEFDLDDSEDAATLNPAAAALRARWFKAFSRAQSETEELRGCESIVI